MAITVSTAIPSAFNKTAQTSTVMTSGSDTRAVGDIIVYCIAADNAAASGLSSFQSIEVDQGAVTWGSPVTANRTPGSAANDGATAVIVAGLVTTGWTAVSTNYTVTWSVSTTAKAILGIALTGAAETTTPVNTNTGTGSGTSVSLATGSSPRAVQSGDCVVVCIASESNTTPTLDADTTNGTWEGGTASSGGSGGDATKMSVLREYKIVTADGSQTYDSTTANTDFGIVVLTFEPKVYSIVPPSRSRRFQHMLVR